MNKEAFKDKYGVENVYTWSGYIDDDREAGVLKLIITISGSLNISPSYYSTIAIGEGLGVYIDYNYASTEPFNVILDKPVDGFSFLGTDDFGSEYNRYKKYLPDTYNEGIGFNDFNTGAEFFKKRTDNELGHKVVSAIFKDLESALWAFGATLKHRKDTFLRHAKEFGYRRPSEDETAYWVYVYFQGEGRARTWLRANKGFNINNNMSDRGQVHKLAMERLASWRYLQSKRIFSH